MPLEALTSAPAAAVVSCLFDSALLYTLSRVLWHVMLERKHAAPTSLRRGADGTSLEVHSDAEAVSLSYEGVQTLEVPVLQELLRHTGLPATSSDRNVLLGQINTHFFGVMRRAQSQRLLPRVPGIL